MKKMGVLFLGFLVVVSFGACSTRKAPTAQAGPAMSKVTGSITYLQKITLSPDALVEVQLLDVSKQDASGEVVGEQTIVNPGQVPIRFSVEYDPARITASHTYGIKVRILSGGELQWISTAAYPVITNDNPVYVDVIVEPAK